MEILEYHADHLPEVAALYNRGTHGVPHCYPVSDEDVGVALQGGDRPAAAEQVWVARRPGAVVGFAHALCGVDDGRADRPPQNVLRFLCYERGRRAAGQALIEAAEAWSRAQGPGALWAFRAADRYWFHHFKNACLSDRLDHVGALLYLNGYRRAAGEIIMDWPDYPEREPVPVDLELAIEVRPHEQSRGDRAATAVRALVGGERVGACWCRSAGEYSRDPDALRWTFVDWLGVDERFRGLGLGKHLLQRGLNEMRRAGYRHACISTAWDNHRAFVLYTHFGFRVVDWTYGLRKELDG
ncbi:MAG: GNAT family N-acetyltransferase [Gemmatimonadota bacterium]